MNAREAFALLYNVVSTLPEVTNVSMKLRQRANWGKKSTAVNV